MTEENITPIITPEDKNQPIGRRADLLAQSLGLIGATLSVIAAVWFFQGFAENDLRPEHLVSALGLTLILFVFAILPFYIVAQFARRAHHEGTRRAHLLWTLFLMLPWVALGALAVSHTPLPQFVGVVMAGLAALLSLWAIVSLVLDWNSTPVNTLGSQQNEVPEATE